MKRKWSASALAQIWSGPPPAVTVVVPPALPPMWIWSPVDRAPNTFSILLTVKTLIPVEPATCNSSALPAPKSKVVPATWLRMFRLSLIVPAWPLTCAKLVNVTL